MTLPTWGEGGSTKSWHYSISLFSKIGDKGEGWVQKSQKMCYIIYARPMLKFCQKRYKYYLIMYIDLCFGNLFTIQFIQFHISVHKYTIVCTIICSIHLILRVFFIWQNLFWIRILCLTNQKFAIYVYYLYCTQWP